MRSLLVCLAVLGGLTLFFLLVLGVGLARFSRMPAPASAVTPAAVDGTTPSTDAASAAPDRQVIPAAPPASAPAQPSASAAPGDAGAILLRPQDAHLIVPGLRLIGDAGGERAIYWQDDLRSRASWDFNSPGGSYDLELTWSSAGAGRSFLAGVGGDELLFHVFGTGLWSQSRMETIGRAVLPAGKSQLVLRQADRGGTPMNLLMVRLVPSPPIPDGGAVGLGPAELPAGCVVLAAAEAQVTGGTLHLEKESLVNWSQPTDSAQWDLDVPRAGLYVVCLVRANAPDSGGPFALEVAGNVLRGHTRSTGSFRSFRRTILGAVTLPAGPAPLTLRPDGPFSVGLMSLRRVELVPADVAALAFTPPPAGPAGNAARSYKVDTEGFIRNWLVLGPIKLDPKVVNHNEASCRPSFDREYYPGQLTATPSEGGTATVNGAALAWTALEAEDYFADLGQLSADAGIDSSNTACLGVAYVTSKKEMPDVKLSIGSDDDSMWRFNGKEVIRFYGGRPVSQDQNKSDPLTLRQGVNVLSFVVINGYGLTAAAARFLDKDGRPVRDVTVSLTPPSR